MPSSMRLELKNLSSSELITYFNGIDIKPLFLGILVVSRRQSTENSLATT